MRFRRRRTDELDVPAGTTVLRGQPADPPTEEALGRLRACCERHPELRAVYLTQQVIPARNEPPTLLLGLVVERGADVDALVQDIGSSSFPLRPGDEYADFTLLDGPVDGDSAWQRLY